MIQMPRRSVTRFFIPLVDVLTLFFCVFLIMQAARPPDEGEGGDLDAPGGSPAALRQELAELRKDLKEERQLLEELRRERQARLHRRLAIRVLQIDPDTGRLYYYGPEQRVEVATRADARQLIQKHREEVGGGRELYYLILFPRQDTGYPEQGQYEAYQRWFAGVPHGFDNPRAG